MSITMRQRRPDCGESNPTLPSLLISFLKIGSVGFGGGMALVALMEQEFVRTRKIISTDEFLNSVGLGQVLGATAVNVAVFIGFRMFGVAGALLSAGAFLLPSVSLVILLSHLYFRYHAIPTLQGAVAGLGPVVIALIISASWSIGRKVLRTWPGVLIGSAALVAAASHINAVWILMVSGAIGLLLPPPTLDTAKSPPALSVEPPSNASRTALVMTALPLPAVALAFFKIGLLFFGGGFVLVPLLHTRLVTELGWLQPQEFLDGLAISNLTPGPIAVLATFTGYHVGGLPGALEATMALFAPGVMLMLMISHGYEKFRDDTRLRHVLAGINPAVSGLILSSALILSRTALHSWHGYVLLLVALAVLLRFRWPPAFVLLIGAVGGYSGLLP